MSRIGKKPVIIPEGTKVALADMTLKVTGPKGELTVPLRPEMKVTVGEDIITVEPRGHTRLHRSLFGLTRTLINNAVLGVNEGFSKQLEIKGVGYKVSVEENKLVLHLGFSHPINFEIPAGIAIEAKKNQVTVTGIDKQLVGETAARIRRLRPPEPYKGKGIKYAGEIIRRKAGKTAKATGSGA
jgi:large subunit ribosomal protein L6